MTVQKEIDQRKTFGRRVALIGGIKAVVALAIAGRMYQLQVLDSEAYATQAEENRINTRLLIPPRGRIRDRFGEPLAVNREDFRAYIVAERLSDLRATLARLAAILPLDDDDVARVIREVRRRRRFVPVNIVGNLTWEEVARVEANAPDLPGVFIEQGLSRQYPAGSVVSHVIGYIGPANEDDLATDGDPLVELPEFRLGRQGVERVYDRLLRGKSGYSQVEINAGGRVLRELARKEGTPGTDLTLTLDLGLQRMALFRMAEQESASCVVMDVHSGDVLAMASYPSYDANPFVNGIPLERWRALLEHPRGPLLNKSVAGQYAPGSTFKMVTALAALEARTVTPETVHVCVGHIEVGPQRFHCHLRSGHGAVRLKEAIKVSCDVYFYQVAMATGIDRIAAMARRLGLGAALGIDLVGERPGLMPDTAWKRATFKDRFHPGETAISGIGQGFILATPLQLATMTARLVNGGYAVKPRLLRAPIEPAKDPGAMLRRPFAPLGVSARNLALVVDAMAAVVNEPGGTALRVRIDDAAYAIGGKTGTSQVRRISVAERLRGIFRNEDLPWERRDHALFVCYGPVKSPRYACAVVVEHGGGGGAVAAPIARDVILEAQQRRSADERPRAEIPPSRRAGE
jgi:penicillin-binding protein 2